MLGLRSKSLIIVTIVCLATVLACILPMGLSPTWNGEFPQWRNQYEVLTQSLLQGKIYLDLPVDPLLLEMENPYDPAARQALGVSFFWDHAFYHGRYYMYFGIVPAILVFLPYQLITGSPLVTYHATQLFTALFIVGLFALFWKVRGRLFPTMPLAIYLMFAVAFSGMSVWYAVAAPALYCTAITSALCMEVWSLFLFFCAITSSEDARNKRRILLGFGALLGALAFGCRPPTALANLIVIPVLFALFKKSRGSKRRFGMDMVCVIAPYVAIGMLLMLYNYVRFDSFFEFGQSYQLTSADQTSYGNSGSRSPIAIASGVIEYFFDFGGESPGFGGVFRNYPILLFAFVALLSPSVREELKESNALFCVVVLIAAAFVIGLFDVLWSPHVQERYRMDTYWLIGVISFVLLGSWMKASPHRLLTAAICFLLVFTALSSAYDLFIPRDENFAMMHPEFAENVRKILSFGTGA